LREGEDGVPVAELVRKHGISSATYYNWKSKYAGVSVSELNRLRELKAENAKLKRMDAELALENAAIKDVLNLNCRSVRSPANPTRMHSSSASIVPTEMKCLTFTCSSLLHRSSF